MIRTIESIKENEVVFCETQTEIDKFCELLDSNGKRTATGRKYAEIGISSPMCFNVHKGQFSNIEYYKKNNYTFVSFKEFFEDNLFWEWKCIDKEGIWAYGGCEKYHKPSFLEVAYKSNKCLKSIYAWRAYIGPLPEIKTKNKQYVPILGDFVGYMKNKITVYTKEENGEFVSGLISGVVYTNNSISISIGKYLYNPSQVYIEIV